MSRRVLTLAGAALAVVLIGVVVAVVLVVAGDDEPARPQAPPALGTPSFAGPSEELAECLSEHGVEPPEEPPQPGMASDPDEIEAMEACSDLLPGDPSGGPPGFEAPAG